MPVCALEPTVGPVHQSCGLFFFGYSHGYQDSGYRAPNTTSGTSNLFLKSREQIALALWATDSAEAQCCHCDAQTATGTVTCGRGFLQCIVYSHKNRKQMDLAHQTGWHTLPMDHNFLTNRSVFLSLATLGTGFHQMLAE